METFGLIMLVVLAVGLQHLSNWLLRLSINTKDGDQFSGAIMLSLFSFVISILLFCTAYDYLTIK